MKDDKCEIRAQSEDVVPGYESPNFISSKVADAGKSTKAPELGVHKFSDTSIITNSQPLNPFFASECPSLDPDADVFDSALLFKSLAELRRQDSENHPPKAFGVTFQNLGVYGYKTSTDYQHTFGNYPATLYRKAFGHGKKRINILNSFDGLVNKGEMLLVLGRPGSGCSTFLKTIAGEMHGLHIGEKSEISYDGRENEADQHPGVIADPPTRSLATYIASGFSRRVHL